MIQMPLVQKKKKVEEYAVTDATNFSGRLLDWLICFGGTNSDQTGFTSVIDLQISDILFPDRTIRPKSQFQSPFSFLKIEFFRVLRKCLTNKTPCQ